MTIDFQKSVLRYLVQEPSAKKYLTYLTNDVFDTPEMKQVLSLLKQYVKEFATTPSKVNFIEYFDKAVRQSKTEVTPGVKQMMYNAIAEAYTPIVGDTQFVRNEIIEFAMKKRTRKLFTTAADALATASDEDFGKWHNEMSRIVSMRHSDNEFDRNNGGFLFKDYKKRVAADDVKVIPIFLKSINKMTTAGGFFSPQNIVFMGAAKRFKTGLLTNIAVDLALSGYKVFYADTENGLANLKSRMKQIILDCTRGEINKYAREFGMIANKAMPLGGDLVPFYFPPGSTLSDVEEAIDYYREEHNFCPHVIIHDYAHNYEPSDKTLRERKHKITAVYKEIPRLNQKYNAFSVTVSPISSDATDKWVLTDKDYGEDKSIAYNCHASFAINRIEEEMRLGTARITPVVQRDGVPYRGDAATTCAIQIDEDRMSIKELDAAAYLATIQPAYEKLRAAEVKPKKPRNFPAKGTITDG